MAGQDLEVLDVHVGGVGDEVGQERPPEAVDVEARVRLIFWMNARIGAVLTEQEQQAAGVAVPAARVGEQGLGRAAGQDTLNTANRFSATVDPP